MDNTTIIICILIVNTIMLVGLSSSLVKIMEHLKGPQPLEKDEPEKQLQELNGQIPYDRVLAMNTDEEV